LLKPDALRERITDNLSAKYSDLSIQNAVGVTAMEHITEAHELLDYSFQGLEYSDSNKRTYVDCQGNTPLHHVVGVYEKVGMINCVADVSKVELLVKRGADINAQNNSGHTPLHVAQGEEAIRACLQHANDQSFTITDTGRRNFWHLLFVLRTTVEVEEIMNVIPTSRAEYSEDSLGRSPLHYACMRFSTMPKIRRFVKDFVDRLSDAHINKQDIFGRTALHYAALYNNEELMRCLQKVKKVDGKIKDNFGKTAGEYLNMRTELEENYLMPTKRCSQILDPRRSHSVVSYVRNIYLGSRFDYSEKQHRQRGSLKQCLYRRVIKATARTIRSRNVFTAIKCRVEIAMKHLANRISSEDSRFACEVFPVGSAHEGTKIGYCDEFDYNFVLTNLSTKCQVGYSRESPPGFVLLKASTPQFDKDLFDTNGTLNTRIVKFKFQSFVQKVLASSQFCETTGFDFIYEDQDTAFTSPDERMLTKPHTPVKLAFTQPVDGCHVMHHVSVDIVPAIQINDWWPEDARRQDLCQTGECLIVFTQPQDKHPWIGWTEPHGFISFARAESRRLRECPQVVKAAYMVVKWMCNDWSTRNCPLFCSHVIKTALLWCLDDSEYSSDSSDEVNEDELLILVQNIIRRLLCFAAQDFVPSYFFPKCRQPVWLKEKYLKQFHTCLYEHGVTPRDLLIFNQRHSPLKTTK